jgi:hypothetical protein
MAGLHSLQCRPYTSTTRTVAASLGVGVDEAWSTCRKERMAVDSSHIRRVHPSGLWGEQNAETRMGGRNLSVPQKQQR